MNDFAPVCSLQMYRRLHPYLDLGRYHLLIATEVVKDPEGWSNFWKREILEPPLPVVTPFIIMDNGLIETGVPTDPKTLLYAASLVDASCIVLPDILGDMEGTLSLSRAALADRLSGVTTPKLGVIQGRTMKEAQICASSFDDLGVKYFSVPRVMVEYLGTRVALVKWLTEKYPEHPIHLLGFSNDLVDDIEAAALDGVMGIDSATPIWYGLNPIREFLPPRPLREAGLGSRPKDYWEKDLDQFDGPSELNIIIRNTTKIRNWIRWERQSRLAASAPYTAPEQPVPADR